MALTLHPPTSPLYHILLRGFPKLWKAVKDRMSIALRLALCDGRRWILSFILKEPWCLGLELLE